VDLTAVSIFGFWVPWLPLALPQVWPFCWWVAVVEDHFSRRVMGFRVFRRQPTAEEGRAFLARVISVAGAKPKYVICDKGPQFWCDSFKRWCSAAASGRDSARSANTAASPSSSGSSDP
jgi:hypothetical protein